MRVLKLVGVNLLVIFYLSAAARAVELKPSVFESELQAIRYDYSLLAMAADDFAEFSGEADTSMAIMRGNKYKSPVKAMLLSLAVPGLGQYYYGSKVKSAIFLGTEITAWTLHIMWHGDAEDMTDEFETFNREHWLESRYERFLELAYYGYTDDDDIPTGGDSAVGITHHLPDTRTQQYYEMTGKYNQFAWGWDDAVLDGDSLGDFDESNPPPRIVSDETTPYSSLRFEYETMRADANDKFNDANKMITVAIINRIISGFEAYFMTRHRNKQADNGSNVFSRIHFEAGMKTFYTYKDTPFFKMSYQL
ncbi:MAG: hypothetical protein JXA92_03220 [candidate division Zixibacteria bacterium]|nr:hypothetical protein [candidate division Zixibacteria bacterium]